MQMEVEQSPALVRFDRTINFGHVLTGICFLFAAGGAWYTSTMQIAIVQNEVAGVKKQVERLVQLTEFSIRQEEKINSILYRLDKMENKTQR